MNHNIQKSPFTQLIASPSHLAKQIIGLRAIQFVPLQRVNKNFNHQNEFCCAFIQCRGVSNVKIEQIIMRYALT